MKLKSELMNQLVVQKSSRITLLSLVSPDAMGAAAGPWLHAHAAGGAGVGLAGGGVFISHRRNPSHAESRVAPLSFFVRSPQPCRPHSSARRPSVPSSTAAAAAAAAGGGERHAMGMRFFPSLLGEAKPKPGLLGWAAPAGPANSSSKQASCGPANKQITCNNIHSFHSSPN